MTKALEKQLNNLTLEQLFDIAQNLDSSFWAYEDLKNFVVGKIQDDDILVATHILNALNDDPANYYNYDVSMGTLEDATTDQNYINKYFSLNCEVISLWPLNNLIFF